VSLFEELSKLSEQKRAIVDALRSGVSERIDDIVAELIDLLEQYLDDADALSIGQLASLNQLDDLIEIVHAAGLDLLEEDVLQKVRSVSGVISKQLDASGLGVGAVTLDEAALQAYVSFKVRDVTDTFARGAAKSIQSAWVDSTFTGKPLREALADATAAAVGDLQDMTPSQVETHVGTAVSSIDRAITAQLTTDDDAIVYLYVGPLDEVVRKSCQWIVSKWATKEQIARLDNGQTPNVLITGGGWNCRHSWAPIKKSIAIKRGLEQVSESDISNFNARAMRTFALRSKRTT
jgi:hypothetical protein